MHLKNHLKNNNTNPEIMKCIIKILTPKKKPDHEKYITEYGKANVYESVPGQMMLEQMDNLVMSRRKAIEDYRKGLVKQCEVIGTAERKTKCGKSSYLCKIQLGQPEGGID